MCDRVRIQLVLVAVLATCSAASASAQPASNVSLPPVEVGVDFTINAIRQDVNAAPACVDLSVPCTHQKASSFGGFGLTLSVARNLSDKLALAGDLSTFFNDWDSAGSLPTHRPAVNRVTSVLIGPKVSTGFFYPGNNDPSPGRFFGQFLVGAEGSSEVPVRPAFIIGAGADVLLRGRNAAPGTTHGVTFRMAIDYQLSPGSGRNLSGWRAVFGFVFGPRVS